MRGSSTEAALSLPGRGLGRGAVSQEGAQGLRPSPGLFREPRSESES